MLGFEGARAGHHNHKGKISIVSKVVQVTKIRIYTCPDWTCSDCKCLGFGEILLLLSFDKATTKNSPGI